MYHVESELQHPLMGAAADLLTTVAAWRATLGADVRAAIELGEQDLAGVESEVARLKAELARLQGRCVVDRLPRSTLTKVRKELAAAVEHAEDLRTGLAEAGKIAGVDTGLPAIELSEHVRKLATGLRDNRASLLSAVEYDRQSPIWAFESLHAGADALLVDLISLEQETGSPVPGPIGDAIERLRKAVAVIRSDGETAKLTQDRRAAAPRRAA